MCIRDRDVSGADCCGGLDHDAPVCGGLCGGCAAVIRLPIGIDAVRGGRPAEPWWRPTSKAVSYTHLDVYKRQIANTV